jgi:flagellar motility protein MotE (MotC chaperone)
MLPEEEGMTKLMAVLLILFSLSAYAADTQGIVDLQSLAARLEAKDLELQKKEADLADKEKRLKSLEEELLKKENELNDIKSTITQRLEDVKKSEDENLTSLAKIYSSTKPKSAAEIIAKMDTDKAVQLFLRMPSMTAGKIMAALGKIDAEKASKISEKLSPEKVDLSGGN